MGLKRTNLKIEVIHNVLYGTVVQPAEEGIQ
jgi:hypothetical protein